MVVTVVVGATLPVKVVDVDVDEDEDAGERTVLTTL